MIFGLELLDVDLSDSPAPIVQQLLEAAQHIVDIIAYIYVS
jgi:hypothetical protein